MIRIFSFMSMFIFFSCNSEQSEQSVIDTPVNLESFEGIITYDVSIEVHDSFLLANYQQYYSELYGDKSVVYINDDGSMLRTYPNSGIEGYFTRGYNAKSNVLFQEVINYDTVTAWDASKYKWVLITKEEGEHDTICDLPCTSIKYTGYREETNDSGSFKYFYSSKLYLDPKPYENWNEGFSGEILQIIKSPVLFSEVTNEEYTVIMRAVKIERKEIPDTMFTIPNHKPIRWE